VDEQSQRVTCRSKSVRAGYTKVLEIDWDIGIQIGLADTQLLYKVVGSKISRYIPMARVILLRISPPRILIGSTPWHSE